MAEIATAALVAEQIIATGLEAGAAVTIAIPTQPLRASLNQIANTAAQQDSSSLALARSHHTVTVIGSIAYIFGGELPGGKLCDTDFHAICLPSETRPEAEYACYPALPVKETSTGELVVPSPRKGHAACARGRYVVIHGGSDEKGVPIEEDECLWMWDSDTLRWSKVHAATPMGKPLQARSEHHIFISENQDFLVLHGGRTLSGKTGDTWLYDFDAVAWTQLPPSPAACWSCALVTDILYSISHSSGMGGCIQALKLGPNVTRRTKPDGLAWETVEFPANPLAPGPKPRLGGCLIPISTGYGRQYLVYMLGSSDDGARQDEQKAFFSDTWALQLPSRAFSPTAAKDVIRDHLPGHVDSGSFSWAEVEIAPREQMDHEGKAHPGPRGFFGASQCQDGKGVVFWGGVNAKGEKEGDGWLLTVYC